MATFDDAFAALESELALVFVDRARVEAACARVRAAGDWHRAAHVRTVARLLPVVRSRVGAFVPPLVALLQDVAQAARSWPLLAGLLITRDAALCSRVLDATIELARAGELRLDQGALEALAEASEQEENCLRQPDLLAKLAVLLQCGSPLHAAAERAARSLYMQTLSPPVRRLAGRILDLAGDLPPAAIVEALVGRHATELLPVLTYTRATHLDVADLVSRPGEVPEVIESLHTLDEICGRKLARDIIGELGWSRANFGIEVRPFVGVTVNGSLPFMMTPLEASLAASDGAVHRAFERIVAIGHGGRRGHADPAMHAGDLTPSSGAGAPGSASEALHSGQTPTESDATTPASNDVVARFRAYNLQHAEALADILDVAPLTVEKVHRVFSRMDRLTGEFVELFATRSDECASLPRIYGDLKHRIETELRGAIPDRPLSVELTRLVQMFEDPPSLAAVQTLHGLKRYLHQRGLALGFGLLESGHGTNRTVDLVLAAPERVLSVHRWIEYADFDAGETDPTPTSARGARDAGATARDVGTAQDERPAPAAPSTGTGQARTIPYPVRVVVDAFARQLLYGQASLPRVRVFCYGNEVHYFVAFRNHPVFIRIDYSPPLSGGMIDLAYYGVSKYDLGSHPELALEGIQACFRRLDFFVEVENTRIHARYDKERARDLTDLCSKAEALFRLVPYLMDFDWTIGSLELPEEARREVGTAWADVFARWGVLPFQELLTADRTGVLVGRESRPEGVQELRWTGHGAYDVPAANPGPALSAALHRAFAEHGFEMPLVSPERDCGQIALEQQVLQPFRDALARGELIVENGAVQRAPAALFERQQEADCLAAILGSDRDTIERSARLARLANALERTLRFETTSTVNGYDVQRASLPLRGQSATLYGLRDGRGMFRLAIFAPTGAIYRHRANAGDRWQQSATCDVGDVAPLLRRNNFLPSWIDVPSRTVDEASDLRALLSHPNPRAVPRVVPGERVVAGMKASPGRAVGPARLGTRGRGADDLRGEVLFAATMSPSDSVFLYHASGVVATGGGILSHAGLMAVQYGRPALIVSGEWREAADGTTWFTFRRIEFGERRRMVAGHRVVERIDVREYDEQVRDGDLVVVDADDGLLRVLGQGPSALALHDGLRQLDAASQRLERVTSPADVLAERGRRLHAFHQLEKLARRLEDPALIQHALRELLTGPLARHGGSGRREQARLLALLRERPANADFVATVVSGIARELSERHAVARSDAMRLLPSSLSAHEALMLRLAIARLRAGFTEVVGFVREAGMTIPTALAGDDDDAEALAAERLEAILSALTLQLVDAPGPDEGLRAPGAERAALPGSAEAASGPARFRHTIAQLERLATVVALSGGEERALARARRAMQARDAARVTALADRLVLWPDDGGFEIAPLAGTKAANLAEMAHLGGTSVVPAWFVVTDRAFRDVLATRLPPRTGSAWPRSTSSLTLGQAIDATVARDDLSADEKSAAIRQLWTEVPLPVALEASVIAAYRRLAPGDRFADVSGGSAGEPFVAIRSSGREEDTESASGAGEFDTFLFVRGAAAVLAHLRRGWAGLWTARAIHDRATASRAGRCEGGGIIVQRIAWARVSGVLQTMNVAEGRTREMVINVGLGLGEGIVSGLVAADHVVVSKDEDPEVEPLRFRYVTSDKRERVVFDERTGSGTVRAGVLSHQRLRAALEYVELVELVRTATRLEAGFGCPLDIEFAFEGAQLFILQARPVPGSTSVWQETATRFPLNALRTPV